ncbi:protein ANTAGONIST OF LIKE HETEROCHROMATIN PROTEIN 1-like [Salvia splendens]|uniref:protein ANTAGONIST OF LIKE HETEROCHROMATIN PROTEIN 1-like n=1 Tax=Salvia splendens TaxID=180675 RepID=UPI001C25FB85|nr:protein ANTAGONIST OF LIKE HETEROCHROMATIN PROTEIN 1-like [Salvia splendens]
MSLNATKSAHLCLLLEDIMLFYREETTTLLRRYIRARCRRQRSQIVEHARRHSVLNKIPAQLKYLDRLLDVTSAACVSNLRMDRNTFGRLCRLLSERGGLTVGKCLGVEEQVAIFLSVLAHHQKNRVVGTTFWRSGGTISYYVNKVLAAVLSLFPVLLAKPAPVPDDCTDHRWKWFKGCLGALDGTHISVLVPTDDKPRYRSRKGQIATNVLAVCDRQMQFVYLLPGWEGSAGDSRVLKDAVSHEDGLKVPQGC